MSRAFVIRPFGKKKGSRKEEIDFERVHDELIAPALKTVDFGGGTTGEIIDAGNVREDMFVLIIEADLVICDITIHNANVFYELGIRHALRKKRTILIKGSPVKDTTPFDILTDRYLGYSIESPGSSLPKLVDMIRATLASDRETDSPIFKMVPALPEVDPAAVQVVPQDLSDEIARASAAKSHGWLRLLAEEVQGLRFQWPALRLIGGAQWGSRDYDGAAKTWSLVRRIYPDDIAANLALANVFQRQYLRDRAPEQITASNQSIERVLANKRASASQRAEALALRGRNAKTLWRMEFESLPELADRRRKAISRDLIKSYESYRDAYLHDLNHFYSGLAALQMASAAIALSGDAEWQDIFNDEGQAATFTRELNQEAERLRASTALAIQAAIARLPDGEDRMWAQISRADLMFLDDKERLTRVETAYSTSIPSSSAFAWESAKQQLELFACLNIKSDLVKRIIAALEEKIKYPPPEPDLHAVIFVGHRIDEVGRKEPRFPTGRERRAKELIRTRLERVMLDSKRVRILASGAPGSDVLCHEICKESQISSILCLPMPVAEFSRMAFGSLDDWRSRFLALVDSARPLQLGDGGDLPRWLQGTDINPWERGNRWVLEMALASARKVTLVAVWDGKPRGDDRGGTAHMVEIARDAGSVDIKIISTREIISDNETQNAP